MPLSAALYACCSEIPSVTFAVFFVVSRINPTDAVNIRQRVLNQSSGTGLTSGNIGVSCTGACKFGDTLTVTTTVQFTAVTQSLLGIGPITLTSSAKVDIE